MLLDFRDDGYTAIPINKDGLIDCRQNARFKSHVDDGAVDRGNTSARPLRHFGKATST
jgi:hypothetical protein